MKKLTAVCVLSVLALGACQTTSGVGSSLTASSARPLDTVEIAHPNVAITFTDTNETYIAGDVFSPPKTIDCSRLQMSSDAYTDALDAGALLVRIETPERVEQITVNQAGQEVREMVSIQPVYGGVLALCDVSPRATGPDSRSYRIRGLDEYLIKGSDGLISVVGAVLDVPARQPSIFDVMVTSQTGVSPTTSPTTGFSWMLWLSDRSTNFTNYTPS